MSRTRSSTWLAIMPSLLLPIILGGAAFFVLLGAIDRGLIENDYLTRYVVGHPVSKVTTAMFLIGLAALLLAGSELIDQFRSMARISFREPASKRRSNSKRVEGEDGLEESNEESNVDEEAAFEPAQDLLDQVSKLEERLFAIPRRLQNFYLWKRLHAGLRYIRQHKSAGGLDDELKYLADSDHDTKHERYSLVRILIWATPMLGFLGTVLGISDALGGISVGDDQNFQSMMAGLQGSLYIAFDTTALALTLSIILMFLQFLATRFESQLLVSVNERSQLELNQYFELETEREDEFTRMLKQMSGELIQATEKLVTTQCDLWNNTITSAQDSWLESIGTAKQAAQEEISAAMAESTDNLRHEISRSIEKADSSLEKRIGQWQASLSYLTQQVSSQHEQIGRQTGAIVDAAEQFKSVGELQQHLLQYMKTLPESSDLIDASEKLATAVRLLEYRMVQSPAMKTAEQQQQQIIDSKIIVPHKRAA